MSGGAAGGLWRHRQWSPSWPPSWILPRIRNLVKTARNDNCLKWIITHKWAVCMILATRFTFIVEKSWKKHTSSLKMACTPAAYYVIPTYLVTIETDHHWTCLKMRARDKRPSTENDRCWCFILLEKSQKNLREWHPPPPPHPLYVRGLKCYFFEKGKYGKGHAC